MLKDPPHVSSLKLGKTALQKCFIVKGTVPDNGKANFYKRLDAFLQNAPAERPKPRIGDTVRCFAVFECQADIPCPAGDDYFDVVSTDGSSDDPRLGLYNVWDECNGKDVYKKYGSEMYLYACHGHDLTIGNLCFDMFDLKEYSYCRAPVLKARNAHLYLFYQWYEQSDNEFGQGRWILGEQAATSEPRKALSAK